MSTPGTRALLALLGATTPSQIGCVGNDDGAKPTSSAGSVGMPDSGVVDPYQSTGSGSGSTGTGTGSGSADPASGNSDPSAGSAETGGGPASNSDGPDTTGPGSSSGTGMTGGWSGSGSSGQFGSSGRFGSSGYYEDADLDGDGWYSGLGTVECGDIPLRVCP